MSLLLFLCINKILFIKIRYVFMCSLIHPLHTTSPCCAHMCHLAGPVASPTSVRHSPLPLFPRQFLICLVADFEFILIRFYFLLIFITFSYISFDFALVVSTLNYLLFVFLVARACSMRQKGNKMSKKKKREREKKRNVYEIYK